MKGIDNPKSGVTLIELLVGIALLGVVMAGAYEVLQSASSVSNRQQQAALASQTGWQILQQMSRELRAAVPAEGRVPLRGEDSTLPATRALSSPARDLPADFAGGRLPADTINFLSVARGAISPHREFGSVEYALFRNKEGKVTGLSRRFAAIEEPLSGSPRVLHSPQIIAMDCHYRGEEGEWESEWTAPALPVAVRLKIWVRTSLPGEKVEADVYRTVVHLPASKEMK